MREGELGAVASTTTLAEGVDLPFRWTLLADWLHWAGDAPTPQLQPMSRALWRNIAGRCGRAGVYTEGDTIIFDNPLGPLEFTAPEARSAWHHNYLSGAEPAAPASALEAVAAGQLSAEVRDTWAAQVLAAVAENPDVPNLVAQLCAASYAAHRMDDLKSLEALTTAACEELVTGEFAQRGPHGGLVLTPLGNAANTTGLSPAACRRIAEVLRELRGPRSLFDAWGAEDDGAFSTTRVGREVSALLLATSEIASAPDALRRLTSRRSRAPLRPADLPAVLEGWLSGYAPEDLFARLSGGRDLSTVLKEVAGQTNEALAPGDILPNAGEVARLAPVPGFDRFADWLRATLENWAPWLCRAAAQLEPFARPAGTSAWPWQTWAAWCEAGVDNDWALEALRRGAPGGRRALTVLGQHWPAHWIGDFDPLGLIPMRAEARNVEFETMARRAVRAVGGRHAPDGKSVLLTCDWLRDRALTSAATTHQEKFEHSLLLTPESKNGDVHLTTTPHATSPFFRVQEQCG